MTLLARTADWICYEFPPGHGRRGLKRWIGQKQIWFLFRFDGSDSEIDITAHHPPEFEAWRWVTADEAPQLVVAFKLGAYQTMLAELGPEIRKLSGAVG